MMAYIPKYPRLYTRLPKVIYDFTQTYIQEYPVKNFLTYPHNCWIYKQLKTNLTLNFSVQS